MRIAVLGAGRVGGAMALDLARERAFEIRVVDASATALQNFIGVEGFSTLEADLSRPEEVAGAVDGCDLVLGAVPGFMGFATLEAILRAGKPVVDISFFPEDPFALDALAKERGVTAIVDCGVAPGLSNLLLGFHHAELDRVDRFACYVGGLPEVRHWPYEYKAGFSPIDVLEEYTRPARLVEHGEIVLKPALSEPELLDFTGVGTLEAFNTDGLRSLLATIDAPFMKEKTLRYPGHIEVMRLLRETGFFRKDEVEVGGTRVRPLDLTAKLLFPMWQLEEGEADLTVMRVEIEGMRGGRKERHAYDLLDRYDTASRTTSMARTTGYTATAAIRLLARGEFDRAGICPPEYVGRDPKAVARILADLAERGIEVRKS